MPELTLIFLPQQQGMPDADLVKGFSRVGIRINNRVLNGLLFF